MKNVFFGESFGAATCITFGGQTYQGAAIFRSTYEHLEYELNGALYTAHGTIRLNPCLTNGKYPKINDMVNINNEDLRVLAINYDNQAELWTLTVGAKYGGRA